MDEIKKKMVKARAGLILSSPFFASIALHLKLKEDNTPYNLYGTAYTDSVVLGYNSGYIRGLKQAQVVGLICHEVLHISMMHPFRRQSREIEKWNVACDYAINSIVTKSGFDLPPGGCIDEKYKGMSAEEIYRILPNPPQKDGNILFGNIKDYVSSKSEDCKDYSRSISQQEKEWKITVVRAVIAAKNCGRMPAGLERIIGEVLEPKLPWREILSRFVTENSRNDYTWKQPNARYLYAGLYLPGLNIPTLGTICVIIDTSGSISQHELDLFASELHAMLTNYPGTEVIAIYVDARVANVETISLEDFHFSAKGGGGTDFKPGFEYIREEGIIPTCVFYFTDGLCNSYPDPPDYPTMWVQSGGATLDPPFGEIISIED